MLLGATVPQESVSSNYVTEPATRYQKAPIKLTKNQAKPVPVFSTNDLKSISLRMNPSDRSYGPATDRLPGHKPVASHEFEDDCSSSSPSLWSPTTHDSPRSSPWADMTSPDHFMNSSPGPGDNVRRTLFEEPKSPFSSSYLPSDKHLFDSNFEDLDS